MSVYNDNKAYIKFVNSFVRMKDTDTMMNMPVINFVRRSF